MIVATLIGLAALAQPVPAPPLRGVIVERGTGRPLAGVTVRVEREPGGPFATTDDQGRFADLPTTLAVDFRNDGQVGPQCWVQPWDERSWTLRIDNPNPMFRGNAKSNWLQAIEALSTRAAARWRGNGPGATLVAECPRIGSVEVAVRNPEGVPLADRPVVLSPLPLSGFVPEGLSLSGRTDGAGVARIAAFEGVYQFAVRVPGVGFGATGAVEVLGGRVARVELPPLAQFARVEGRLAPGLVAPGIEVALVVTTGLGQANRAAAPCDEAGRFAIADVAPGSYRVVAVRGEKPVPTAYREARPEPGRDLADIVLEPPAPPSPEVQREQERNRLAANGDRNRAVPWVEGTVRDERGEPVPGAAIQLLAQHSGGFRAVEETRKATADGDGRYRIEGPPFPNREVLTVVASAPGRPPAVAFAQAPQPADPADEARPARVDLALGAAGSGASVAVAVYQDGRPMPGVGVQLTPRGVGTVSTPFYGVAMRKDGRAEVDRAIAPRAVTGADGVARFSDLLPGGFTAVATASPDPNAPPAKTAEQMRMNQPWTGRLEGIVAPPGGRAEAAVSLLPPYRPVRFRILRPDGTPVADRDVALLATQGARGVGTQLHLGPDGVGTYGFDGLGAWSVRARFRDSAGPAHGIDAEPYYQAETWVPIATPPAVEDEVTLRVARLEPASLRVRLIDASGRPARGIVTVSGGGFREPAQSGTTDADGRIRFTHIASGKHKLGGVVAGGAAAPRPQTGQTRLDDAALRDRATVFDQDLTLAPGADAEVELREQPVGYVRAILRAPAGRKPAEFVAYFPPAATERPPYSSEFDLASGSLLIGPVRAGRWTLSVRDQLSDDYDAAVEREVVVEPGRVAVAEVAIPDPGPDRPRPARRGGRPPFPDMAGGIDLFNAGPGGFTASAVLPDGSTPAFAARGLFFPPGRRVPAAEGVADATGRLTWTWVSRGEPAADAGPEPMREPTVVAWLPGLTGAAVATPEFGKPLRLVLPGAGGASGRLTQKGGEFDAGGSLVRVVATPEGRSVAAAELAREAAPDRQGRFRFPALAPGRYAVQATRDGVWLSRPAPLVVEPGKESDPVELEMPDPGAPVALNLVDRDGRPLPHLDFTVPRPGSPPPVTPPMPYRTDDRGVAVVRGLPAGPQALVAADDPSPRTFQVPPARPGPGPAVPQALRVEVPRPTP